MKNTTLCYIEKDGKYLMLHRTKKEADINKDKWLGIGGKFEKDESPEECIIRETREETGLELQKIDLKCIITYVCKDWETEYTYVYTSKEFDGELIECNEGDLEWVDIDRIPSLNLWEGDKIFLKKIQEEEGFFTAKFVYDGDKLLNYKINQY